MYFYINKFTFIYLYILVRTFMYFYVPKVVLCNVCPFMYFRYFMYLVYFDLPYYTSMYFWVILFYSFSFIQKYWRAAERYILVCALCTFI